MTDVAAYIDHTVLNPSTVMSDVKKVCAESLKFHFAAVCIPPPFVRSAKSLLHDSDVKVATVIGFPFGYSNARAKLAEVQQALSDGADELDIVINLSALKSGNWSYLQQEMKLLIQPVHENNRIVKVIIESGILTDHEIIECCKIYS